MSQEIAGAAGGPAGKDRMKTDAVYARRSVEKKAVATQFIRRIEVAEDSAEIIWAV